MWPVKQLDKVLKIEAEQAEKKIGTFYASAKV